MDVTADYKRGSPVRVVIVAIAMVVGIVPYPIGLVYIVTRTYGYRRDLSGYVIESVTKYNLDYK